MMDAFDVLGLGAKFDLSDEEIGRAYLRAVAGVHPDLGEDAQDDEAGGDDAAGGINAARAALRDPEQRAAALLRRLGGPGPEDRTLPPGFLMEMMEVREQIEAAVEGVSEAQASAARAEWLAWSRARRAAHIAAVAEHFRALLLPAGDSGQADQPPHSRASRLAAIRVELNAWRYAERLIEQLTGVSDATENAGHDRFGL